MEESHSHLPQLPKDLQPPYFSTLQPHPSRVVARILLSRLPVTLYHKNLITVIDECISPIIRIDSKQHAASAGVQKSLVSKLLINGRLQVVEYEPLPNIYFKCGKYDHVKDTYLATVKDASPTLPHVSVVHNVPSETESFGPWMMVERRQRRKNPSVIASVIASIPASTPMTVEATGDVQHALQSPVAQVSGKDKSPPA
ncbi:hypothetical protein V6N13_064685 [Hibiscus sabdariffa]